MNNNQKSNHIFDLEDRTTNFAVKVVKLCRNLPQDAVNIRLIPQVIASAGSIGANYREANDALGKKDFLCRLKISRKEAKETCHWLTILIEANIGKEKELRELIGESNEYKNILSSIINKFQV